MYNAAMCSEATRITLSGVVVMFCVALCSEVLWSSLLSGHFLLVNVAWRSDAVNASAVLYHAAMCGDASVKLLAVPGNEYPAAMCSDVMVKELLAVPGNEYPAALCSDVMAKPLAALVNTAMRCETVDAYAVMYHAAMCSDDDVELLAVPGNVYPAAMCSDVMVKALAALVNAALRGETVDAYEGMHHAAMCSDADVELLAAPGNEYPAALKRETPRSAVCLMPLASDSQTTLNGHEDATHSTAKATALVQHVLHQFASQFQTESAYTTMSIPVALAASADLSRR